MEMCSPNATLAKVTWPHRPLLKGETWPHMVDHTCNVNTPGLPWEDFVVDILSQRKKGGGNMPGVGRTQTSLDLECHNTKTGRAWKEVHSFSKMFIE